MTTKELILYDKELPSLKFWAKLSEADKKWLQEENSGFQRDMGSTLKLMIRMGLRLMRIGTKVGEGGVTDFIIWKFGEGGRRTGFNWKNIAEKIAEHGGMEFLEEIAFGERDYFSGLRFHGPVEFYNNFKELPSPKGKPVTPKLIEGVFEEVKEKSKERRAIKKAAKHIKPTEMNLKIEVFDGIRLPMTRAIEEFGLDTSAKKKAFLAQPFGWTLDHLVIGEMHSEMVVKRTKVPDEANPNPVGAPPGPRKKKK